MRRIRTDSGQDEAPWDAAAVESLRQGASNLAAMSVHERISALSLLGQRLKALPICSSLWSEAAEASGYSAAMLEWGFEETFSRWTEDGLRNLVQSELPELLETQPAREEVATVPHLTGVVLASTVPPAGVQSALLPMLLGSGVFVRPATRLRPLFDLLSQEVFGASRLRGAIGLTSFPSMDAQARSAFTATVDALAVSGSDETVLSWRRDLTPGVPLAAHGHRLSAAYMSATAQQRAFEESLNALALDICAWDQTGCLSPHTLFVEGSNTDCVRIAEYLCRVALPHAEERLPPGPLSAEDEARRTLFVRSAMLEATAFHSKDGATVLVYETSGRLEGCGQRVLNVRPVDSMDTAIEVCLSAAPHLQALGVAGVSDTEEVLARLAPAGLNRICAFGEMQRPPLMWQDGIGALAPLVRWNPRRIPQP